MRRCTWGVLWITATVAACSPAAKTLAKLGEACVADADCGSASCAHDVCTRTCALQGDCPTGFDCVVAAGDAHATCVAPTYDTTQPGGFGTSCTVAAAGCTMGASPCASGFTCAAATKCDPDAVCSRACATDRDCPPAMRCGSIAEPGADAMQQVCRPRLACDSCATADACGAELTCASGGPFDGRCLRACAIDSDCPHAPAPATPFETCLPDAAGHKVCQPKAGVCSAATPAVCAPCRDGHPEDCGSGGTLRCFKDAFSLEQFCTEACTVTVVSDQMGGFTTSMDSCPSGTLCEWGGPPNFGAGTCDPVTHACVQGGACGKDPTGVRLTCTP